MKVVIDPSKAPAPILSGSEPLKGRRLTFYCAVCADGKRQKGDYRKHLLEHLHKASHEITLAKLELDMVFGTPAFPHLLWSEDFENLAWLGIEEAENLCKQIEEYLKNNR